MIEENSQSLSIEECRRILGDKYSNLTNSEIDQLRIGMELLADMTIQAFKQQRSTSLIQKGSLDSPIKENV